MVTLKKLLGSCSEVHYECMYTKNKTQKRKVWHDGFVSLSASRKLVLFEDMPPDGKVIDEVKMTPYDWDRKDEEFINVPKFLVEIINETPINIQGGASSYSAYSEPVKAGSVVPANDLPPPRSMNSTFKVPVSSSSGGPLPRLITRPGGSRQSPLGRSGNAEPLHAANKNIFDFDRNPTSEWDYQPNAVNRSGNLYYVEHMWQYGDAND